MALSRTGGQLPPPQPPIPSATAQPVPLAPGDPRGARPRDHDEAHRDQEGGEVGDDAWLPATTYAAVFGTDPSPVASRNGSQPIRDTAAQ